MARTRVAVFASESADLFEALRLPRSVPNQVAIGHSPLVGPLARLERRERWCVALVNRRDARIFRGSPESLREIEQIHDEVFGQHDQGGWSQSRYQRGIEKEKDDHLKHTGEALMRHFKQQPFQRLIVGGPREVVADFESKLHPYLQEQLAGRIEVDVEHSNADAVLEAAGPLIEELERDRERSALELLGERGVGGVENVLPPLHERRVETLLLDEQFGGVPGVAVPGVRLARARGRALSRRRLRARAAGRPHRGDDRAVGAAVGGAARVRHAREELEGHGGAAALLRF